MYFFYSPMEEAARILCESSMPSVKELYKLQSILEDTNSPVRNKYIEKLYDSVINKSHIDFDNIPDSKGNIVEYSGYTSMIEVLENIMKLAVDSKSESVIHYVNIIKESITHMRALAPIYQKGFRLRNEYVMLEYNTFVYTTVQATSTLLYEFVEYIKKPTSKTIEITLKNTQYRANTFYIDQLNKYNVINNKMNYQSFLENILQNGKEGFLGFTEVVGLAAIVTVALAIIPVTRSLVYSYYNLKSNLSDCLAQQAYFLELNKSVVEANSSFNDAKKANILLRQEKVKNLCVRLSEKLRVTHIKAVNDSKAVIQNDNKLLTLNGINKEISDSPLSLL